MRAAVRTAVGRIDVVDRPEPQLTGDDQVIVRIAQVGICGGDLHYFLGEGKVTNPPIPLIVGHEGVGVVVEAGPLAERVAVGDRVVIDPQVHWCGYCDYCVKGERELCAERRDMGYMVDGACAELVQIPWKCAYVLPDAMSWSSATHVHGLAATLHALEKVPYVPHASAVVLGPGPAGLYFTQLLKRQWGCSRVILVGRTASRLSLGLELGADYVIDSSQSDIIDEVTGHTGGTGADIVIETTGSPAVQEIVVNLARPGGSIVPYAPGTATFPFEPFLRKEVAMFGSTGATGCIRTAIQLIESGSIEVDPMATHVFDLAETARAFEFATSPEKGDFIKGIVRVAEIPEAFL